MIATKKDLSAPQTLKVRSDRAGPGGSVALVTMHSASDTCCPTCIKPRDTLSCNAHSVRVHRERSPGQPSRRSSPRRFYWGAHGDAALLTKLTARDSGADIALEASLLELPYASLAPKSQIPMANNLFG